MRPHTAKITMQSLHYSSGSGRERNDQVRQIIFGNKEKALCELFFSSHNTYDDGGVNG